MGKDWYRRAETFVDEEHPERSIKKTTPVVFWSHWPMCQMNYCETMAKEGVFDEKAQLAWQQAASDWKTFGSRQLPSVPFAGQTAILVQLSDKEKWENTAKSAVAQLEQLKPGLREEIRQEKLKSLTPAERKVYDLPADKRMAKDWEVFNAVQQKLRVSHEDVAFDRRMPSERRGKARELARDALEAERRVLEIESQRNIVNFAYWQRRADVEQTREALDARRAIYLAQQANEALDLGRACELYAEAFGKWRQVLDKPQWPDLKKQEQFGGELVDFIREYGKVLEKWETPPQPFPPKNFILQDILDLHEASTPPRD